MTLDFETFFLIIKLIFTSLMRLIFLICYDGVQYIKYSLFYRILHRRLHLSDLNVAIPMMSNNVDLTQLSMVHIALIINYHD